MNNNPKISLNFNIKLICFCLFNLLFIKLFEPENKESVPWDIFFDKSPTLSIITAITLSIITILWGSKLLQTFWNQFLSEIFRLRNISTQEALTLTLLLSLISF